MSERFCTVAQLREVLTELEDTDEIGFDCNRASTGNPVVLRPVGNGSWAQVGYIDVELEREPPGAELVRF